MRGGVSLAAIALSGLARLEGARALDVPGPSQFLRHAFPAVAVLGDYVYIDGGEISQLVDGQLTKGQPSYPRT